MYKEHHQNHSGAVLLNSPLAVLMQWKHYVNVILNLAKIAFCAIHRTHCKYLMIILSVAITIDQLRLPSYGHSIVTLIMS